jgi:hypothetical protein
MIRKLKRPLYEGNADVLGTHFPYEGLFQNIDKDFYLITEYGLVGQSSWLAVDITFLLCFNLRRYQLQSLASIGRLEC